MSSNFNAMCSFQSSQVSQQKFTVDVALTQRPWLSLFVATHRPRAQPGRHQNARSVRHAEARRVPHRSAMPRTRPRRCHCTPRPHLLVRPETRSDVSLGICGGGPHEDIDHQVKRFTFFDLLCLGGAILLCKGLWLGLLSCSLTA